MLPSGPEPLLLASRNMDKVMFMATEFSIIPLQEGKTEVLILPGHHLSFQSDPVRNLAAVLHYKHIIHYRVDAITVWL